jgi:hypothetical protein
MAEQLVWSCAICDLPIADGAGYLTVDLSEAKRVLQWRNEWEAELRSHDFAMRELETCPERTRWLALHAACDPVSEQGAYELPVKSVRTAWDMLSWTGQLIGHAWLEGTDWRRVLWRVAEENGRQLAS